MPISSYTDSKAGQTLFKVRVSRSSSTQPGVIVDKRAIGFKTKFEAERAEKKLFVQIERELVQAEQKSCLWEVLVDDWKMAARRGDIFVRELSPQTVDDYSKRGVLQNR